MYEFVKVYVNSHASNDSEFVFTKIQTQTQVKTVREAREQKLWGLADAWGHQLLGRYVRPHSQHVSGSYWCGTRKARPSALNAELFALTFLIWLAYPFNRWGFNLHLYSLNKKTKKQKNKVTLLLNNFLLWRAQIRHTIIHGSSRIFCGLHTHSIYGLVKSHSLWEITHADLLDQRALFLLGVWVLDRVKSHSLRRKCIFNLWSVNVHIKILIALFLQYYGI